MDYHKLLQKQVKKHLTTNQIENPSFKAFFQSVNTSYLAFERDKGIMEHTFKESEKEYNEINDQLKKEIELKQLAFNNLYKSINEDDLNIDISYEHNDDLLFVSEYLRAQISQRKEIEDQLYQNNELLKTLLSNLQSGIMVEDVNRKIIFINQLFCDLRNIERSPDELMGTDCIHLLNETKSFFKNSEHFVKVKNKTLQNQKIVLGELLETVDNRLIERDFIPILINNQNKGNLWKYTDVTSKIQTQKLLQQSEEHNRLIMNASLNAIVTIDINGLVTFWNDQAEIIFGWNKEEVLGKELSEIIIPHRYVEAHHRGMKHYLRTGEGPVLNKPLDMTALNRKGVEFPVEMSIIPVNENDQVFFCAFIQDVSEKKEAENSRKIQEEKYQNVIANMNLGLLEIDNEEIIQYVNQSFASMSGYERSELIGKNPSELFVFGENFETIQSKNDLRKQGVSDIYQLPIKNKRGELKWWTISGAPNYDNKGNVIGSIGIHLDITGQKQLEIDLEKEKTNALESSKAKEIFLANMSHEIRTPLNAIIGFLRELEKQELTEIQKKHIVNSSIASKHLLAIINNILDISKIEAGEMSLENEDFALEKSIINVTKVLQPMLEQKGLNFNITISKEVAKVLKGDKLRLQQILFNLVGNAIKFTDHGSISINCEVVNDTPVSQELKISISDTGIGMENSFIESVFNKFSQEDKEITRKYGGTGLGLSITKELVKLMNGRIEIESEKNIGTTISVYLSYPKGSKEFIEELDINKPITRLDNISILLVEDNYLNRMVAQNSLQYYNCEVAEAENGLQAIEILKNQKFDLILMDIQMPEMGGIEATEIIRKELNLTTPIIALTANAFKTEIDKCKKAGMDDYVTKPFDEDILIETIAKHTVNKKISPPKLKFSKKSSIEKLYNLTSLQNLSRGDNEFIVKMISIFIEQTTDVIKEIREAILLDDFLEVNRLIHKIKPSVESLGITSIISEIKLLEKADDKEQIRILFAKVKEVLEQTVLQLLDYIKKD